MSNYIIFDTETTGLPQFYGLSPLTKAGNWPDIVSISWLIYDSSKSLIGVKNYVVRPEGWVVPKESTAIHGITHEDALTVGLPLKMVLEEFKADLKTAKTLIAHNMAFDRSVVLNAYKWRLGYDNFDFFPNTYICTMELGRMELKMPCKNPKYWKPPKLDELYEATFGVAAPAHAHSSLRDTEVCAAIYWKRWG
jgi:DNA polymerase-3 subunit epsilon